MKKYFRFLVFAFAIGLTLCALRFTPFAHATDFSTIYQSLAQADPVSYIVSGFNYVAGFIAALVVLMILYGVIKKMASPGSSSAQGESKALFWNLAGGFLLFALAYFFFTNILSPDLGTLKLPTLTALQNLSGTGGGANITCKDAGSLCANSPQVNKVLDCLGNSQLTGLATTWNGGHTSVNSCHFGGPGCKSTGSHAIDWGANGLNGLSSPMSLQQMDDAATKCLPGGQATAGDSFCRCETADGGSIVSCTDPSATHVHCDVAVASCGCN